ncbi:RCC1 domain-containing protein, partial [Actinoplanes philippinensis]|uniref:RCC1 domain-containing protein n=1 Tax=Actinoplanes philippinensis TaxID=35752 RepID=UPI0033D88F29
QLGDGSTAGRATPRPVAGGGVWRSVVAGTNTTCGVRDDGTLWCWGLLPRRKTVTAPQRIGDLTTWTGVSAGEEHLCARRADATLWCWGVNAGEVLGNRITTTPRTPVPARREIATTWAQVAAGDSHTCGRDTRGRVWCWGFDGFGQRGDAAGAGRNDPIGLTGVAAIDVKGDTSCALGADRRLWCWGSGVETPRLVTGDRDWTHVAVGNLATCGVRAGASLWCWGVNQRGQVGDGTVENRAQPTRIGTDGWLTAGGGYQHTCGIRTDHSLWCWGDNRSLQLGSIIPARRPVPVPG